VGRPAADDAEPHAAGRHGSRPGVFYNTGHGHLGWTLSAATAQMVADAVHGEAISNHVKRAA
jgi:D-amino-acid dehydrogenase